MKNERFFTLVPKCLLACVLVAFIGCVTTSQEPIIIGSTTPGGRGNPNGSSEQSLSFVISKVSTDPTYGYTKENPVKVGGTLFKGPARELKYLRSLLGPNGEAITFERRGSCCPFTTPYGLGSEGEEKYGLLDVYEIKYEGLKEIIILYLDMYDPAELLVPVGFTASK